ncbi:MAG: glycosyltransferase family 1 protein [Anaerolineae bacterium]|nr:glycosyltransferase family 4 protein [Anaerolineae bacterium]MDW8101309.1 glycosyltransferase family 1 protein [Anaerolineae bacterium]
MPVNYVLDLRIANEHFPGIGRYGINLAWKIPKFLEKDERLVLIRDPGHCSFPFPSGDKVETFDIPSTPFSLAQQWLIPLALKNLKPCLYHSLYYVMPYRPATVTLLTVYDLIPLLYPQSVSLRARLLFRYLFLLALSSSSGIIVVSNTTLNDLKARFKIGGKGLAMIPLAADPAFQPCLPHEREAVRLKYKLPERFILFVGSHKPHKNLENLLKAFARTRARTNAILAIAGPGSRNSWRLRALAQKLGLENSVRWLGRVPDDDLPALYSASAAFVFPSLYEGFGLPVLEAMSCSAPVICSDIPALREVAGEAAFYFNPLSPDSIAQAIDTVMENQELRKDLTERGLARAAMFSWDKSAHQTIAFYRKILG